MATTDTFPKHDDDRDDLLALAADVMTSPIATAHPPVSAREAARALVGVVGWVVRRYGVLAMQRAMADLARHDLAWKTAFRSLPTNGTGRTGRIDEELALIASVASGLLPLLGAAPMRAAVAFWATEQDPAIWQSVAAAA